MSDETNDANVEETNGVTPAPENAGGDGESVDDAAAAEGEPHGFFGRLIEGVETAFEGHAPFPTAGEASEYGEAEEQRLIEERDVL